LPCGVRFVYNGRQGICSVLLRYSTVGRCVGVKANEDQSITSSRLAGERAEIESNGEFFLCPGKTLKCAV
jgi:hypothetical protein